MDNWTILLFHAHLSFFLLYSPLVNSSFSFFVRLVPLPLLITGLFIGLTILWTSYISISFRL